VQVRWVHFPLHPETPQEGMVLADYFRGRGIDPEQAHERMSGLMAKEGLPYGKRTYSYNSRLAQELGKWAETQPGGEKIHDALFRAYFVDGRNIGSTQELLAIAASVGLDAEAAERVLTSRSYSDAVDADWRRSAEVGVTGVPTFVAGGFGVVGAQPYDVLEQLVQHVMSGAKPERTKDEE
jgi:predicted DsbA family dithiol-disulfide isomerase